MAKIKAESLEIEKVLAKAMEIDDEADLLALVRDLNRIIPDVRELINSVGVPTLTTFLQLTDTPSSYSGQGGLYLAVKGDETGVEFIAIQAGVVTSVFGRTGAITAQAGDYNASDVGLNNVDNTSDVDKPVSTAQSTAINAVATNLSTHESNLANPHAVTKAQVGLANADNTSDVDKPVSTAQSTAINAVATNLSTHESNLANPHVVTKAQVGLGSADNTSDVNKPVSTATQTALDLKEDDLGVPGVDGYVLSSLTDGTRSWISAAGGSGDVVGPASSTNNGIVSFNGTTGKLVKDNSATTLNGRFIAGGGDYTNPAFRFPSAHTGYYLNSGNIVTLRDGTIKTEMSSSFFYIGFSTTRWSLPYTRGTNGQVLVINGSGDAIWTTLSYGDASGPASSTDNALPRFNGTGGKTLQASSVIVDDSNNLTGVVNLTANGQIGSTINDVGASGTTKTIDFDTGNVQFIDLTGNVTFTLSNPVSGFAYNLVLKQDATGSRTATWPAAVKWPGGTAPTLSTAANAIDVITLIYNGLDSEYYAAPNLAFA